MSDADDINSPREAPSKPRTTIPMRSTVSSFAETVMASHSMTWNPQKTSMPPLSGNPTYPANLCPIYCGGAAT
jgi:hypothetical protein